VVHLALYEANRIFHLKRMVSFFFFRAHAATTSALGNWEPSCATLGSKRPDSTFVAPTAQSNLLTYRFDSLFS
jgi:hypothetical protein